MMVAAVLSLSLNVYQHVQIEGHLGDIKDLNETHHSLHSEWEADKHSVEECRKEMKSMDTHMNQMEADNIELELEVTRLQGEVLKENL